MFLPLNFSHEVELCESRNTNFINIEVSGKSEVVGFLILGHSLKDVAFIEVFSGNCIRCYDNFVFTHNNTVYWFSNTMFYSIEGNLKIFDNGNISYVYIFDFEDNLKCIFCLYCNSIITLKNPLKIITGFCLGSSMVGYSDKFLCKTNDGIVFIDSSGECVSIIFDTIELHFDEVKTLDFETLKKFLSSSFIFKCIVFKYNQRISGFIYEGHAYDLYKLFVTSFEICCNGFLGDSYVVFYDKFDIKFLLYQNISLYDFNTYGVNCVALKYASNYFVLKLQDSTYLFYLLREQELVNIVPFKLNIEYDLLFKDIKGLFAVFSKPDYTLEYVVYNLITGQKIEVGHPECIKGYGGILEVEYVDNTVYYDCWFNYVKNLQQLILYSEIDFSDFRLFVVQYKDSFKDNCYKYGIYDTLKCTLVVNCEYDTFRVFKDTVVCYKNNVYEEIDLSEYTLKKFLNFS